jgi:hypothetical protein
MRKKEKPFVNYKDVKLPLHFFGDVFFFNIFILMNSLLVDCKLLHHPFQENTLTIL